MKLLKREFIFSLPLSFAECHASTVLALDDGSFLAAWFGGEKEGKNDVMIWLSRLENGKFFGPRSPLSVYVSEDNGKNFKKEMDLETGEGEFSYPAVISKDDKVYTTYTHKRKSIVFCEIQM